MSFKERTNWAAVGAIAALILVFPLVWGATKDTVKLVSTPDELQQFKVECRTNFYNLDLKLDMLTQQINKQNEKQNN